MLAAGSLLKLEGHITVTTTACEPAQRYGGLLCFSSIVKHQQSDKTQDAQRFASIDHDRWFGNW